MPKPPSPRDPRRPGRAGADAGKGRRRPDRKAAEGGTEQGRGKDARRAGERGKVGEARAPREAREARPARKAGEARPPRKAGEARPPRDAGEARKPRDAGEARKPRRPGARPPRQDAEARAPRAAAGARPPREEAEGRAPRSAGDKGPARRPGDKRPPRKPAEPRRRADGSSAAEPAAVHREGEPQRIAKLLARAGIASRREVERMIADRRIAVAGAAIETPATVLTSLKGVTVDGKPVRPPADTRLFLFHKPVGLLTAERDFSGRPTIYDRLPKELPRVMPVGRLDLNTEGLLLLTNDGGFKRQLELPSTGIERSYRARVFGEISQDELEQLSQGVEIEGVRYGSIDANLERRTGRNGWVEMRLKEGKNREVRRVLEHLGLQVSRLIRTAYGPFVLADLPSGAVVEVRQHELVEFRKGMK